MIIRSQNRSVDAMRPVSFERHFTMHAAGSVLVSFGNTKVLCTASEEDKTPPWLRDSGKGWVTAEYAMLPGSSRNRVPRDAVKGGRAQEISRLIGRSLRAVVDLEKIGPRQITVDCDVLQADGGTRTAAISGACVALYDTFLAMVEADRIQHMPMSGMCAAVSVGKINDVILVDLDCSEDNNADVDMNLVMDETGRFIEIQGSAEKEPFSYESMEGMLKLGSDAIRTLIQKQREVLAIA